LLLASKHGQPISGIGYRMATDAGVELHRVRVFDLPLGRLSGFGPNRRANL
jgi:hypothetical protein